MDTPYVLSYEVCNLYLHVSLEIRRLNLCGLAALQGKTQVEEELGNERTDGGGPLEDRGGKGVE